jgi:hypothetical protein
MAVASEPLFSYGTLQLAEVQRANFGRLLEGASDELVGFVVEHIEIADPEVVALSGKSTHLIVRETGVEADRVAGMLLMLTSAELAAADEYETDDYTRIEAVLASGRRVWVYARV